VRAYLNLRFLAERNEMFTAGLERLGYEVVLGMTRKPEPRDIFVTWSRIHEADEVARIFTDRGNKVIVAENCSFGSNTFAGRNWYHFALGHHNVAGRFPVGGPERWDSLGVELEPWRSEGETVVIASRGIGPSAYRMPANWPQRQQGRIRPHPGRIPERAKPLREDLAQCGKVITWGSAGAVLALMWGIQVESHQREWIAACENTDEGRLHMLRKLAWAQATHEEIRSGDAFARLLTAR
jgi:hypothetical protein